MNDKKGGCPIGSDWTASVFACVSFVNFVAFCVFSYWHEAQQAKNASFSRIDKQPTLLML